MTEISSRWSLSGGSASVCALTIALGFVAFPCSASAGQAMQWNDETARQLLTYIQQVDRQGLVASQYQPEMLSAALASRNRERLETSATRSFSLLALDLVRGHIPAKQRGRFFITSDTLMPKRVADLIDDALKRNDVGAVLDSLAPHDAQYQGLVAALAQLPRAEIKKRRVLLVNLERRRWLPHTLAEDRLEINIPEYNLRLIQSGHEVASYRVIVGKPKTPTPQFTAEISGIILNPTWQVPQSIIAESVGRLVRSRPAEARSRGFVWRFSGRALQVVQQPGPKNALGLVKFDMPNPLSVYLHDTPDRQLFERAERAFSHGCMRVDHPRDLAVRVLAQSGFDRAAIDAMIETGTTRRLALPHPIPVLVIYQTAIAEADGSIRYLDDPYHLDTELASRLQDSRKRLARGSGYARQASCTAANSLARV